MNRQTTKILIADQFPSLNKGELAILEGILKTLEALGETDVSIFSFNPELDNARYPRNIRLIDVKKELNMVRGSSKRSVVFLVNAALALVQHVFFGLAYFVLGKKALRLVRGSLWREYCGVDVIITCHDQESCLFGPFSMPLLPLYITLLAKTLRKPVAIYGNGTYKFKRRLWRNLARYVLDNVDLVTTREKETFDYLREIATNKSHILLTADPAFLLPAASQDSIELLIKKENLKLEGRLSIGITITDGVLSIDRDQQDLQTNQEPIDAFADIVDCLIEKFQATVVFLPHRIGKNIYTDDRYLARQIYNNVRNREYISVITNEYSAQELKGLVSSLDLFIGSRIHSVIGAVSQGVPSIVISRQSDIRANGIIGEMFGQRDWIYEVKERRLNGLLSKIERLVSVRRRVSKELLRQAQIVKAMAYTNGEYLRAVLQSREKTEI